MRFEGSLHGCRRTRFGDDAPGRVLPPRQSGQMRTEGVRTCDECNGTSMR